MRPRRNALFYFLRARLQTTDGALNQSNGRNRWKRQSNQISEVGSHIILMRTVKSLFNILCWHYLEQSSWWHIVRIKCWVSHCRQSPWQPWCYFVLRVSSGNRWRVRRWLPQVIPWRHLLAAESNSITNAIRHRASLVLVDQGRAAMRKRTGRYRQANWRHCRARGHSLCNVDSMARFLHAFYFARPFLFSELCMSFVVDARRCRAAPFVCSCVNALM